MRQHISKRLKAVQKRKNDRDLQATAWILAKRDPVFFVNEFVWTQDPRLIATDLPASIPFNLFDYQEDFIRWLRDRLEGRESGVVEKSRDTGFTWMCASFAVWLWLFKPQATVCFGSRKVDLVDKKKDPDCIFAKVRFIIESLPDWMKPTNPDTNQRWERGGEFDNHLRIINPENGAAITGEGGDQMGRGGRALLYIADEWAFVPRADQVDSALSMNTEVVIYGSSANGMGNNHYQKVKSEHFPTHTLHWSDDPRKSKEWRQAFLEKYGPLITAREVDIDYTASVEGILIKSKWVEAAVQIDLDDWKGDRIEAGLDVGDGGTDSTVFVPRRGPVVGEPRERMESGPTQTGRWATGRMGDVGGSSLWIDVVGVGSGVYSEVADKPRDFQYNGVNPGESPTDRVWNGDRLAKEMFRNLRAEMCWTIRERFRKTFEHVTGEKEHQPRDLISLPDHPNLKSDCSILTFYEDAKGRIKIESKNELKRRLGKGSSPDFFDALVYAFAGDVIGGGGGPRIGRA